MDVVSLLIYRAMSGSGGQTPVATDVSYDNTTSGLLADNVQNAIDELSSEKISISEKGSSGGVAELNENGIILTSQLPSYVDDVLEFDTFNDFPQEGESGKIYVDLSTNKTYRWGGSAYVEISESLALGETSSTAYRGDRGKVAYDHSQLTSGNPHNVTKSQVGLGNVDNTSDLNKPISTATQIALNAKVEEDDVKEIIYDVFNDTTVEGNPISFKIITGTEKAKSCEVTMLPIQDLHGYDSPWPAGAGKNKIDQSTITKLLRNGAETSNGITNSDGEITVTYTYGNQGSYSLSQVVPIHSGEITISADFMVVGSSGSAQIRTNVGNNTSSTSATPTPNKTITLSALNTWENKSVTYSLNENASDGITIALQVSASGMSLKIKNLQVEIGSTATDYAPYENICPIGGWDGLNLTRSGKNLVEITKTGSTTYNGITWTVNSDGTVTANGTATATSVFLLKQAQDFGKDLQPNTEYIISSGYGNDNVWFGLYYDNNTSWGKTVRNNGEETFTTISDFNYVRFGLRVGSGETINNVTFKPMVRLSTISDPTFEPYNGETYPATFSETTYGGSYDFVSGKGNANYSENINISDLTWMYSENNGYFYSFPSGKANGNTNIKSSSYKVSESTTVSGMVDGEIKGNANNGNIYVKDSRATTVEEFLTLSGSQTICYKLATPTPIELIGQEMVLNKGDNILFTDGDNIKLVASQIPSITEIIDDNNISENHTFSSSKIDEFTEEKTYEILNDLTSDITKVGNPISVNMKFGNVLNKCNLTMNPIQDLHGYNAPWMGGNGKNKIGSTLTYIKSANTSGTWSGNNYTLNGVTFAVLVDNDNNVTGIKVTGTASDRTDFKVGVPDLVTGTDYIVNGCPANGSDSTYRLTCLFNTNASAHDRGSGSITFTATGYEGAYCYIRIADGYSITTDGLTYYPMVRLATEIDATFAPYSNNCSISGRDNTFVTVCGKNIFDKNARDVNKGFMDNSIIRRNGSIAEHTTYYISEYMLLKPNTYYTLTGLTGDNVGNDLYDVNKEFVRAIPNNGETTRTFLTADNECYIRCSVHKTQGIDILQLEEGSTATNYEEYQGKTETITFPEIIYGGTDEIISGIGESTYGIVDIGEVNWAYSNSVFSVAKSEIGMKNGTDTDVQFISDIYPRGGSNTDHVVYHTTQFLRILDSNYTDLTTFKTAMAGHKICFTLETPNIVTTSPETIILNKGYNVISADADGMSIKYTEMITIDDVKNIINDAIGSILNTEY